MNPELQTLVQFQELELRIEQLQARSLKIPEEIAALDRQIADSRKLHESIHQKMEQEESERRRLEREVQALQDRLSKYRGQLMEVKTNKEYQAVLHEIALTEAEVSRREDQILGHLLAVDEWEQKSRLTQSESDGQEREYNQQKAELEAFASDFQGQLEKLRLERQLLQGQIPDLLLQQYRRIAAARQGVALAAVKDQSCQACHVKLRPQLAAEVRTNSQIITCEHCNRILYFPEP